MNTPEQTLTYFLNSILENPKEINIKKSENTPIAGITTFEITAPSEFLGQIIGKNGKIIKAIRTLMVSSYPKQKFNIQITDEKDPSLHI